MGKNHFAPVSYNVVSTRQLITQLNSLRSRDWMGNLSSEISNIISQLSAEWLHEMPQFDWSNACIDFYGNFIDEYMIATGCLLNYMRHIHTHEVQSNSMEYPICGFTWNINKCKHQPSTIDSKWVMKIDEFMVLPSSAMRLIIAFALKIGFFGDKSSIDVATTFKKIVNTCVVYAQCSLRSAIYQFC